MEAMEDLLMGKPSQEGPEPLTPKRSPHLLRVTTWMESEQIFYILLAHKINTCSKEKCIYKHASHRTHHNLILQIHMQIFLDIFLMYFSSTSRLVHPWNCMTCHF
jgi:hypothetical protein